MTILLNLALIVIGMFILLTGALSLRVKRKQRMMPKRPTYGPGVDMHMLRTGIEIEHGMVITKLNKLQAQSKLSDSCLESMLLK